MFTLNHSSIFANIVKVGALGSNGTLRIGGGSISANTLMQLYAPGSNGIIDFVRNVTLRTSNAIPTIAANTVTIENGVVVTINAQADGVPFPADVFTNVANYTGSGGNGSTTGTFAGTGANGPQALSNAAAFDARATGNPSNGKRSRTVINVPNSGQLVSLLDGGVPSPDRRLR